MNIPARIRTAFHRDLVRWFECHRRSFLWRTNCTPYRVWISELMLQQTRAGTAIRYYQRFMKRFPSLRALARAPRQDVLKLWEGLGYYARARHAHDTAKWLVDHFRGEFPRTRQGLLSLPGIGQYTAAAIGSLALGLDLAVVDGNVARVLSRVMAYGGDVTRSNGKKNLQSWADELLIPGKAALSNESLMELGALVCAPRNPACHECPLRGICKAFAAGNPERYPVKKKKSKVPHRIVSAGVVMDRRGRILIAQREETSMLGGLWEFPGGKLEKDEAIPDCIRRELEEELGILTEVGRRLLIVHHAYSHFTIDLHAHWARIVKGRPRAIHCADFAWVRPEQMKKYPFSKADLQIVQFLENLVLCNARHGRWRGIYRQIHPFEK